MNVKELKELLKNIPDETEVELAVGYEAIPVLLFSESFIWKPNEKILCIQTPNWEDDE